MTVKFQQWYCAVARAQYLNKVPALLLVDTRTGEHVARATVNIPGAKPKPNHVFIKNWSENEGMYESLVEAGVIKEAVNEFPFNRIMVKECPMTDATLTLPVHG